MRVLLTDHYVFIAAWTSERTTDEVLDVLEKVSVPAGKIYDAKDIVEDEHINARGMIESITVGTKEDGRGWDLKVTECVQCSASVMKKYSYAAM